MLRLCKTAVKSALKPFGLTVNRLGNASALEGDPHAIYGKLGIDLVLDVGANEGYTGTELRQHGYAGRIVSFEPLTHPFRTLQERAKKDPLWECRQVGLGDCDQKLSMNVCSFTPASSLLPMAEKCREFVPKENGSETEQIVVARLDTIADELKLCQHKVLLKIDVQGYESHVLRGAATTLPQIRAAFVELLFVDLYEQQSKYFDVMAALEQAGLRMVGLFNVATDKTTGHWMWADGLFVRQPK